MHCGPHLQYAAADVPGLGLALVILPPDVHTRARVGCIQLRLERLPLGGIILAIRRPWSNTSASTATTDAAAMDKFFSQLPGGRAPFAALPLVRQPIAESGAAEAVATT